MNQRRKRIIGKRGAAALLLALLMALSVSSGAGVGPDMTHAESAAAGESKGEQSLTEDMELGPYYSETAENWKSEGVAAGTETIRISAAQFARKSAEADAVAGTYQGKSGVLIWQSQKGWVEYEVSVGEDGLYEMAADYYPLAAEHGGSRQPVILAARINGGFPFREARSMAFDRAFRDVLPAKRDAAGNEMRAQIAEIGGWKTKPFTDSDGAYERPLLWRLNKGVNRIRIEAIREPFALEAITLKPQEAVPAYEEAKRAYPADAGQGGTVVVAEGENASAKSSPAIQNMYDRDPRTSPRALKTIAYNTLGGARWSKGGQSVSWEIEVPDDGLYKLNMRVNQNASKNKSVFRSIEIDGKLPFQEMASYLFPYSSKWQGLSIADERGEPYAFYLTKGKHTLTMTANYDPYTPVIARMNRASKELRAIVLEIRTMTGNREDKYRVWDVERDMPGITERLRSLHGQVDDLVERMKQINREVDDVAQSLRIAAKDLDSLLRRPNKIPYSITTLGAVQETLESKKADLAASSLQVDRIYVSSYGAELPRMTANALEKAKGIFSSLAYSFRNEESFETGSENVLNVWMVYGRDYVNELQQLSDERFTPETGIKVKINLVPSADMLILANAAGMMPDVALGVPANFPFDMALRNAALDLSKLPGADELFARYHPGTLLPFYYDGGYYGLPETINFKVLFYRKDILRQLKLNVPDTWDDVNKMLPTLLQNQYNFYMDPADFTPMFFQSGVELYSQDGTTTGLDSPESFASFKTWTDFYNKRGLDRVVQSFYNRFRSGEMPIGVADFNMYMQLLVAAPEITNEWGIAPVPGTVQPDGSIVRWAGGSNPQNAMLFKATSGDRREKAWQFLQWYVSTETQSEFGQNLEQFYGESFRWNSANVEAFARMPWKRDDLNVILEQWKWTKEIPQVPGGYMTARELGFAWNRTAVDAVNYRLSLEKAIKEIKRELARKGKEFHIVGEDGEILKPLDLPEVTEPWKGVDQLVR
ncbi:extracellular solute-binding protein [Paenibacillus spongiae]|uniref:Extracellular solute-binding protein n=1 Tax=Paenibacillus spongiae TaxID=2909671 RepID=A0ABY5S8F0_9BACL|nr:extracellular solute-binding protein [Paenibacillus spongiae]UVI30189.1 extracellular solute-binding protein [Paenibacillus spongiae]